MPESLEAVDEALREIERLRVLINKSRLPQVRNSDEKYAAKASANLWREKHYRAIVTTNGSETLDKVNHLYGVLLGFTIRNISRSKYKSNIKDIKTLLGTLQEEIYLADDKSKSQPSSKPDFSKLIQDQKMQAILSSRWEEAEVCIANQARLAAVVMMGGILESILLARVNALGDSSKIDKLHSSPRDKKGKVLELKKWSLSHFIDVAQEMGWISQASKDVSGIVRNYRNLVHPEKEYSSGISVTLQDLVMFWGIVSHIAFQVIDSAK